MRQGSVTSWFDVHGGAEGEPPSKSPSEPSSTQEERRPYISPFQTLKDEKTRKFMMASYSSADSKDRSPFASRSPVKSPGTPYHKPLEFSFEHETSR